ncbi:MULTISPECIES: DEAD/DEAH box helicase [Acidithiobacillus]|uniref:DEAD/DEAH box helicase n=1 Tax=Acidithiobacillus ferruginosus TaxID=3063951 RepID=A0ACD5IK94_9PROT|nr:DEAD/DEAH box helicase [Acidithiobacillus ferruginosus]MBU2814282.1 DEAD/DEAH box helicase [Acidithiobacillus ferruginosus]
MPTNNDWMNWHRDASAMPTLGTYGYEDVRRWVGDLEIRKAQPYQKSISHLEQRGSTDLSALVQGTARTPYRVDIHLSQGHLVTLCTCPVGSRCKHVTAVLLALLAGRSHTTPTPAPALRPHVMQWLSELRSHLDPPKSKPPTTTHALYWLLELNSRRHQGPVLSCRKARLNKSGECTGLTPWYNFEGAQRRPPSFIDEADQRALRRLLLEDPYASQTGEFDLGPRHGAAALAILAGTGRLFANSPANPSLRLGDHRPGTLVWKVSKGGEQYPALETTPPATSFLSLDATWYLDGKTGEIGPIETDLPTTVLRDLLQAPPLNAQEAILLREMLEQSVPGLPTPVADPGQGLREIEAPLQALLWCDTLALLGIQAHRDYAGQWSPSCRFDYAQPTFVYGPARVAVDDDSAIQTLNNGEVVRIKRDRTAEKQALQALEKTGLKAASAGLFHSLSPLPHPIYGLASEADWDGLMSTGVETLRERGWEVRWPDGFRHYFLQVDEWDVQVDGAEEGWLGLDVGIVVDGKRLALPPLLGALFARDPRWLNPGGLSTIPDDEHIHLHTPAGVPIQTTADRLKPLVGTLIDLFSLDAGGPLRMSALDAPRLARLVDGSQWRSEGMDAVRALARSLPQNGEIPPVPLPAGFALPLRAYQQDGLAWLQFLREHHLGGILADDMGLGKTAQTLAHLLLEKESGRLTDPALIIMPTSLIHNWREEAARFTPGLRVLSLHGKERGSRFAQIPDNDLILTTYPLIWRDVETLRNQQFHLLILDEAQMVKNAQGRAAEAIREIPTRHRLALTGTPLENHLGELWAQFDFFLPGFLGDQRSFQRVWRGPIERHGDAERLDLLARRVRPFILRRRKEDVAKELPEKTIIIRPMDIEGAQRDLYETVRSAMDERIRQEIAAKGFQRSQIVILDAMLKLRQVCCDPRLLKSEKARKVQDSAKLALLMEMIPELLAEGRQILLFSQFTEMLALISARLDKMHIPYALLTGSTRDRKTPIDRFQRGEVPLFLISLKAGGVGLNLTAADTVIHYDPWWNPAAENQATDRAHRIGQKRQVFVYKLIVAGSIEEKILALQEKKAILAAGVLEKAQKEKLRFGPDDLTSLLAPLPEALR